VLPGFGHIYRGEKKKGACIALVVCLILLIGILIFEKDFLAAMQHILETNPKKFWSSTFSTAYASLAHHLPFYLGVFAGILIFWAYAAWDLLRAK
jgi:hypothetical protein